jgi:hypothetical protein
MFDPQKIKLKYSLGVWKDLPGYPSEEDVQFELISTIGKISEGKWEISEKQLESFFNKYQEFSHQTMIKDQTLIKQESRGKTVYTIKEEIIKLYI